MSNYNLKPNIIPSLAAQEKKEKRQKVLEAVRARRRQIYTRFNERVKKAYSKAEARSYSG